MTGIRGELITISETRDRRGSAGIVISLDISPGIVDLIQIRTQDLKRSPLMIEPIGTSGICQTLRHLINSSIIRRVF
jgi:hypothetical protein